MTTQLKMKCRQCGKLVRICDPYENAEIKRASAWFAAHKTHAGKKCIGSRTTAIDRVPRPASQDSLEPT